MLIQVTLKLPLQLRWKRGPDMDFTMSGYVQSVKVRGTVYVGGGIAGGKNNTVMTYDTYSGKWAELPPYSVQYFAMAISNNTLVLVGGYAHGSTSKMVGAWRPDSNKWTHFCPDMLTARNVCSAVGYKEWLVVAGGVGDDGNCLTSVEILNTHTKQWPWSTGPSTPVAWCRMRTAIVDDICYFMGGLISGSSLSTMYSVSLPALISQLGSREPIACQSNTQIWKKISGLHLTDSTPLSIGGSLFAVGGKGKDHKALSVIYLYQCDTGEWVKVGNLPTPRYDCTCIMIAEKELLVAGGSGGGNDWLKRVDIASL